MFKKSSTTSATGSPGAFVRTVLTAASCAITVAPGFGEIPTRQNAVEPRSRKIEQSNVAGTTTSGDLDFLEQRSSIDYHAAIAESINAFVGLPEDWDGRGSAAPSRTALENARQWAVQAILRSNGQPKYSLPFVGVDEDGNVALLWTNGDRRVTAFIDGQGVTALLAWGADPETEMEERALRSPRELQDALTWLQEKS